MCKLSGAVGTYSNVDPAVERHVGERARAAAGAGDAGHRPRPPRRAPVGAAPRSRRRASWSPSSCATSSAPRWARCSRASSRARRARRRCPTSATRSRPRRSAVWPASCAPTCWPGCRTSRCGTSATSRIRRSSGSCCPTRRCSSHYMVDRLNRLLRGPAGRRRADAATTCGRATAWCSASRCCWRWSRPARRATTPTASSSATRCGVGGRRPISGSLLEADPEVTLDADALDEAFDLAPLAAPPRPARRPGRPRGLTPRRVQRSSGAAADAGPLQHGRRDADLAP